MEQEQMKALPGLLLPWFRENARALPWRQDREPYRVWLSEIMLQQTRVEAVKGYYARFLQALPDVFALAEAPEEQLLKLWEGLGYYNRARNLQKAARLVAYEKNGVFPDTYEGLLALPGVGEYTAGAVASICFDRPCAAVDGNVLRVLSRYLADGGAAEEQKKRFRRALEAVYPPGQCGAFTQALMELGAAICLPNGAPLCEGCPLAERCAAKKQGDPREYPRREAKKPRRRQTRTVFLLDCGGRLAICQRPPRGLLAGLWQLPDLEGTLTPEQALAQVRRWGLQPSDLRSQRQRKHIFTHVEWDMTGYEIAVAGEGGPFLWVTRQALAQQYALPTAFRQFLEK